MSVPNDLIDARGAVRHLTVVRLGEPVPHPDSTEAYIVAAARRSVQRRARLAELDAEARGLEPVAATLYRLSDARKRRSAGLATGQE